MTEKSMWGDLSNIAITRTPKTILQEQGNILGSSTKFVLRADVEQTVSSWEPSSIIASLSVYTPRLKGYVQNIVTVEHPIQFYPLAMTDRVNAKSYTCTNEEEFVYTLEKILTSGKVREVLSALLSYAGKSS